MANVFQIVRSVIYILLLAALAFVLLWNYRALDRAVQNIFEQMASINTIEAFGLKLSFDKGTVQRDLKPFLEDYGPEWYIEHGFQGRDDYESHISALSQGLSQQETIRLMYADETRDLCRFEHPTPTMRVDLMVDHRLRDKGLTKIWDSPETFERVRGTFATLAARNELPAIGYPTSCYEMRRTADGSNVKTVLVRATSRRFAAPERSR